MLGYLVLLVNHNFEFHPDRAGACVTIGRYRFRSSFSAVHRPMWDLGDIFEILTQYIVTLGNAVVPVSCSKHPPTLLLHQMRSLLPTEERTAPRTQKQSSEIQHFAVCSRQVSHIISNPAYFQS